MIKKPEIAFFGSSLVSAYWNGAATYYRGILRALARLGYKITFYEPDAYERQEHRDIDDPEYAEVKVYKAEKKDVYEMLRKASNADIIIKASGVGVFDELLEKEVLELKDTGNLVIFWDVDAPATLDRMERDLNDAFRELVPSYDLILTYGGGDKVVNAYTKAGARACIPIYNALDTSTHYPAKYDERFDADLVFLGNRLPDREKRVEDYFLKVAEKLPEKTFLLGGNGWDDKPMAANIRYIGHVYTSDHNSLNSTAKAILNISRDSMAKYGFSPATRVFEAAGAGACIITDHWEGIDFFFKTGSEILVADSPDDLVRILKELTPEKASAIGEAAYNRVLSNHTYNHRAEQLDKVLTSHLKNTEKITA